MTNRRKQILGCLLIILIPMCGCGIFALYSWAMSPLWEAQIQTQHEDFCTAIDSENWDLAYTYMTSSYKENNSFKDFENAPFKYPCDEYFLEKLEYASTTGKTGFVRYNSGIDNLFFFGTEYELVKENGNWYFTGNFDVYID